MYYIIVGKLISVFFSFSLFEKIIVYGYINNLNGTEFGGAVSEVNDDQKWLRQLGIQRIIKPKRWSRSTRNPWN